MTMSRNRLVWAGIIVAALIVLLIILNLGAILNWVRYAVEFIVNPHERIDPNTIIQCSDSPGCQVVHPIIYSAIFLLVVITGFAYTTLLERRFIAWFQHRVGPNRVGPKGFLQPAADAVKLIFKEDIVPSNVYKAVYYLAPMIKVVPVLLVMAVIPLGPDLMVPWFDGNWYVVPLGIADPNVGVLWLLAITSLGTYGVALAGWASNNKYAMLGGIRASAQMISYELSLGLAMAVPIILAGSMSLGDIINQQKNIWEWYVFQNPLAAGILLIALLAEVNRAPFDLPEAEQELTQGYMTEYSGMRFALFMMAEYLGMIAVSMIAVALFFGGYHLIPVDGVPLLGALFYIGKVVVLLVGMIWVRATLPRIRYDRLMQFGWKVLLPLSILAVAWSGVAVVISDVVGDPTVYGVISGAVFAVVLLGGFLYLRRSGEAEIAEPDLDEDPVITGEPGGIGYAMLTFVGALIAVPFVLMGWLANFFEGLSRLGTGPEDSAIEAQSSKTPARRAGAD